MNIKDKIKTFEDACASLNLDPQTVIPDFSAFPETDREAMIAHTKLIIINKALNEGWTPDWSNGQWDKYYPWFDMRSSSSGGFASHGYGSWYSPTFVCSRLCFKSRELAEYAGNQFKDLYEAYFVIK